MCFTGSVSVVESVANIISIAGSVGVDITVNEVHAKTKAQNCYNCSESVPKKPRT